ncbi:MAG: amidase [Janthinobacterium lividum]
MSNTLIRLPLSTVIERFASRQLSPVDYLESFLQRVSECEPTVKAFTCLDHERLREAARASAARYTDGKPLGILDGIPVGIKDIIDTADMPTGYGSAAFVGHQPRYDAACVRALRAGGALLAGKTVSTEFAYGVSGPTTNPHDAKRSPGGSSSGSAAAVGAGMLPLALGTQTLGSILRPASFNGIVGFKPSHGALSMAGVHPMAMSLDHLGTLADDTLSAWIGAAAVSLHAGPTPGHPGIIGAHLHHPSLRRPGAMIHLYLAAWEELRPEEQQTMRGMVDYVRSLGITVHDRHNDARIAAVETVLDESLVDAKRIVDFEMRHPYSAYVERYGDLMSETVRSGVSRSATMTSRDYESLLSRRSAARAQVDALLRETQADGFMLPAASGAAPLGLSYTGSRSYLTYWSWLGFPAISLPLMMAEGMPWGLQIGLGSQQDRALIEVAQWFEANLPRCPQWD